MKGRKNVMENFIRKIMSRKFLLALAIVISGLIVALGGEEETAERVYGLIVSAAGAIAYITGESRVDAANAASSAIDLQPGYYTVEFPHITDENAGGSNIGDTEKKYDGAHLKGPNKAPEEQPPDEERDDF